LPNPVPLTDEDMLINTGLHMVIKDILAKLCFPDLVACANTVLGDENSTTFLEESLEVPPLQSSIDNLPNGFKISSEDQTIVCPHSYVIVFHKTTKTYTTYLLANLSKEVNGDGRFLVLFYNCSVDCTVKTVCVVEDSLDGITVKVFDGSESQPLLSSYNELLVESCKTIVCVELTSMLQERGFDHLEEFATNYKYVNHERS
jgi:hypothetical protein